MIEDYNFDTSSDLAIQIGNGGKEVLTIENSPSIISINEVGDFDIPFKALELNNLPQLQSIILQRQDFNVVELIDFPQLTTVKVRANEIFLEKIAIELYETTNTNSDVRIFASEKLTFKNCPNLKVIEFKGEILNEVNVLEIPDGTYLEFLEGSYENINIRSSNFITAEIFSQFNAPLNIGTANFDNNLFDDLLVAVNSRLDTLKITNTQSPLMNIWFDEPNYLMIDNCMNTEIINIRGPFLDYSVTNLPDLIEYDCHFITAPELISVDDHPLLETLIITQNDPQNRGSRLEYSGLTNLNYFETSFNRVNEMDEHIINFEDEFTLETIFLKGQSNGSPGISKNALRLCNLPLLKNFNQIYLNDTLNLDLSSCPSIELFDIPRFCDTLKLNNGTSTLSPLVRFSNTKTICVDDIDEQMQIMNSYTVSGDPNFVTDCNRDCSILSSTVETDFDANIDVYPNPFINELTIKSEVAISSITIFDVFGREIYYINLVSDTTEYKLSMDLIPVGAYFMKLDISGHSVVRNIIATN